MDGFLLQPKVQKGYSKCAIKIGAQFFIYRPRSAINPIQPLYFVTEVPMSANVSWDYMKSNRYGTAVWNLIVDCDNTIIQEGLSTYDTTGNNIYFPYITMGFNLQGAYGGTSLSAQVGDYLIPAVPIDQDNSIYFVAAEQYLLPPLGVKCNRTIQIIRPTYQTGAGFQGYSEYLPSTSIVIASGMPASVLEQSQGKNDTKLPTDTKDPKWIVLFPDNGSIIVRVDDIIIDDLNQNYVVTDNELTELGWRVLAQQVVNSR